VEFGGHISHGVNMAAALLSLENETGELFEGSECSGIT
jgi:hypothetical protein